MKQDEPPATTDRTLAKPDCPGCHGTGMPYLGDGAYDFFAARCPACGGTDEVLEEDVQHG